MDYSEIQQLYIENEKLISKINQLTEYITKISPARYYLNDILINSEYDYYFDTFGVDPNEVETKDLKDSSYKTLLTLIEFFEDY
tara:strand:+ start:1908 stop:2159 length:252 start_codon:yes stop_codon:yes gene_type:complete